MGLAAAWVSTTALLFRAWRDERDGPAEPLREGVEPQAAPALRPVPDRGPPLGARPGRTVLLLAVGLLTVISLVAAFGFLVTDVLTGTWVGRLDRTTVRALTTLGLPALDRPAAVVNALGSTRVVVVLSLMGAVVTVAALRRWRPALFLLAALAGEVTVYPVVSRLLVLRDRPAAGGLHPNLPDMASFPSGHAAAAMTLYGAIALIAYAHLRGRWRAVALAVPVVIGLLVGAGRLYRGVHYPTDVLASALLATAWLAVTYHLLMSNRARWGEVTRAYNVKTPQA